MSVAAQNWVFDHVHEFGIDPGRTRDDFGVYRLAELIGMLTDHKKPHRGVTAGHKALAARLRVSEVSVKRWKRRLVEAGLVEVVTLPPDADDGPRGRGRPLAHIVLPAFLAELGVSRSGDVTRNSSEELGVSTSGDVTPNQRELGVTQADLGVSQPDLGVSQGRIRGQADPSDQGFPVEKGKEGSSKGKEGAADADHHPTRRRFPDQCINHQDKPNRGDDFKPCPNCGAAKKAHADSRELTRAEVDALLGEDFWNCPEPPQHLGNDDEARTAWMRERADLHRAERRRRAKALQRAQRESRGARW